MPLAPSIIRLFALSLIASFNVAPHPFAKQCLHLTHLTILGWGDPHKLKIFLLFALQNVHWPEHSGTFVLTR